MQKVDNPDLVYLERSCCTGAGRLPCFRVFANGSCAVLVKANDPTAWEEAVNRHARDIPLAQRLVMHIEDK